ncbi:MAG: hypothetical protein EKK40_09325 [Bradyrhizobiaceae bacterium]|nr:MAG: hypothetical protein EKK40_09325 [Bradyrhizobiaceae bacterium]
MRKSRILLAVLLMSTHVAVATEILPPPHLPATSQTAPKDLPVQANQPHCSRWTDDCVSCTRGADGEAPACSNIGAACQPKAIRCLGGDVSDPSPANPSPAQ